MQVVPRESESALSVSGPRPMEWSTVPYTGSQAPGHNAGNVIASGSHDKEIFLWGPPLVVSGSDDGTSKLWDLARRVPSKHFQINTKSQLSVSLMHRIRYSQVILKGTNNNFEKNLLKCSWVTQMESKVTAGSEIAWFTYGTQTSRRILYKLPGHTGSVNECVFHPTEPIIGSCSSDKQIYLGEI
ncbi:hypothetical protein D5086_033719 [Populus alba]|uniref:Uncharacterized protein n=1 Tax=Populus alba TaxID=43335 RepID=A0ACC4AHM2_POPAL